MSGVDTFLAKFYKHVDDNQEKYIKRLAEMVAMPSVSAWPEKRQEIVKVCNWTAEVFIFRLL